VSAPDLRIELDGYVLPWQRVGVRRGPHKNHRYTVKEQADYQTALKWAARRALVGKRWQMDGRFRIEVRVYVERRDADWDNYGAQVSDALNGVVWLDDRRIDDARVVRAVDRERPRIEVDVWRLE
jgi:Holliday junction resolvase RusA-like endonuclease